MESYVKKLVYKGCKQDFIEDELSSSIALVSNILISGVISTAIVGATILTGGMALESQNYPNIFAYFLILLILFMVATYSPTYELQCKSLRKAKVTRPFYFIMEFDKDNIELKVDFDKDHRRTNKQYKINLDTVEGVSIYTKQLALSDDRFIRNGDFVKPADNPDIQFVKIDTNKVGSLSNIGNRKISYIVPRYDDKGTDMLVELYKLLGK